MVTNWCMPWGQLAWLRALDDGLARKFFDTADSFVIGGPVPGYSCWPVRKYASFAAYAREWPPGLGGYVCYDNEHWADTPVIEQQHPLAFMSAFAATATARGQVLIAAPSRDLVWAPGADCQIDKGAESIDAAYLRCGIPGAARDAAVLLVQSQGAQKDPAAYAALVQGAKAQAPADQTVWAGLTTAYATPAQMLAAYNAVEGVATGFWVTIAGKDQAPVAAGFFRDLAG